MRIVHLGRYYGEKNTGGAAIAATRLHRALVAAGEDSVFICLENRSGETERVVEWPPRGSLRRLFVIAASKISRNIWRFIAEKKPRSLNIVHTGVLKVIEVMHPDIVHVHWITDEEASFSELRRMNMPLIMHLHDLWMLNAFEPYPHGDRRYVKGFHGENSRMLELFVHKRKMALSQAKKIAFIGPSSWAKKMADESLIAKGHRNFSVPYFQNPIFSYHPELRQQSPMFRILFGAYGGRSNPIKGFADLVAALKMLDEDVQGHSEVLVFGEKSDAYCVGKVKVRFLGEAKDPETLLHFYHSADVFAFPSKEETWGQTKSEAMLCGLPVIAFNRTACAEGIVHAETGWIAADGNIAEFVRGLKRFFDLHQCGELESLHADVASSATRIFDNNVVLRKLMAAYREVIHA